METISNFGILLMILGGILLVLGLIAIFVGRKGNVTVSIPGDGFRPFIPRDGMPMPNLMEPSPTVKTEARIRPEYYSGKTEGRWKPAIKITEQEDGSAIVLTTSGDVLTKSPNRVRGAITARPCQRCG